MVKHKSRKPNPIDELFVHDLSVKKKVPPEKSKYKMLGYALVATTKKSKRFRLITNPFGTKDLKNVRRILLYAKKEDLQATAQLRRRNE